MLACGSSIIQIQNLDFFSFLKCLFPFMSLRYGPGDSSGQFNISFLNLKPQDSFFHIINLQVEETRMWIDVVTSFGWNLETYLSSA